MLIPKITGIRQLQKDLKAESKAEKKALETAIKMEGFRLLRRLRDDIRSGQPGGMPYNVDLSYIARRTNTGRMRKNPIPLYRLARLLRYNVDYHNGNLQLSFGFVQSRTLTGSWKRLILKHAEGVDTLYTGSRTEFGRRMARIGGRLKKQGDPDAKYFFLKKSTDRHVKLPERPMIEPFWDANKVEARRNIGLNFHRKIRGARI